MLHKYMNTVQLCTQKSTCSHLLPLLMEVHAACRKSLILLSVPQINQWNISRDAAETHAASWRNTLDTPVYFGSNVSCFSSLWTGDNGGEKNLFDLRYFASITCPFRIMERKCPKYTVKCLFLFVFLHLEWCSTFKYNCLHVRS